MAKRDIRVYRGTVTVTKDDDRIAARRAIGDTDAANDVSARFVADDITAEHKDVAGALEQLASELRSIADSMMAVARRTRERAA